MRSRQPIHSVQTASFELVTLAEWMIKASFMWPTEVKELIKVKGPQVAPVELEGLLLSHPKVQDCAGVGIHDDYSGERPKAYVVTKPEFEPNDTLALDVFAYVKTRLVRDKLIRELEFVLEIPRNPSGEVLRRILKKEHGPQGPSFRECTSIRAKLHSWL